MTSKDSFKDSPSLKTHFRILQCSNEEKETRGGICTLVRDEETPRSYVLTIPYAKVNLLSRLGGHFKTGHMWPSQNRPYELYPDRVVLLRLPTSGKLT